VGDKEEKKDNMREGLSYSGREREGGDGRVLLLFSFYAETVSGAAPQQQREKSMMNN